MNTKLQKLGRFAEKIWEELDDKAKELYYCDTGTCGFLEDVVRMHHDELTHEEYEELSNYFDQMTSKNFYAKLRNVRLTLGDIEYIEHDAISKAIYDLSSFVQSGEHENFVTSYKEGAIEIEIAGDTITVTDGCEHKTLLTIRLEA